jgi:hypothetical protein
LLEEREKKMGLDLRIPVGLMFALTGLILTVFGMLTHGNADLYAKSLGVNINLWWGLELLIFGTTMFAFGFLRHKRMPIEEKTPEMADQERRGH